jgi:type VII secretion protein EccB
MPPSTTRSTRLQVSGHRFLVRRMTHALVRGDVDMLDDPLRAQTLSLLGGAVLTTIAVAICAVLTMVRPSDGIGDAQVLLVRETGALYVRVGDVVHPVYNLTSAWLIVGRPTAPRPVSQKAVDRARRGPPIGIAGAPQHVSLSGVTDPVWMMCDTDGTTSMLGGVALPDPPDDHRAVLVTPRGAGAAFTYLLYDGRRARVDLRHPAVVRALHLDHVDPQPVSTAVLEAFPEAPPIVAPHIPDRGRPGPGPLSDHPVGTVVAVADAGPATELFVVLTGGLQRVGEVTADLIRYTDARVGAQIPTVTPDVLGVLPVVDALPVATYPTLVEVTRSPAVCARWIATGSGARTDLLTADRPPITGVALAQADGDGPQVDEVSVPGSGSLLVQAATASGAGEGSLFLLAETGVLYGLENADTAAKLGFTPPAAAVAWSFLSVLPRGPELSTRAASVTRDVVATLP